MLIGWGAIGLTLAACLAPWNYPAALVGCPA